MNFELRLYSPDQSSISNWSFGFFAVKNVWWFFLTFSDTLFVFNRFEISLVKALRNKSKSFMLQFWSHVFIFLQCMSILELIHTCYIPISKLYRILIRVITQRTYAQTRAHYSQYATRNCEAKKELLNGIERWKTPSANISYFSLNVPRGWARLPSAPTETNT